MNSYDQSTSGPGRTRTCDALHFTQPLFLLSYRTNIPDPPEAPEFLDAPYTPGSHNPGRHLAYVIPHTIPVALIRTHEARTHRARRTCGFSVPVVRVRWANEKPAAR